MYFSTLGMSSKGKSGRKPKPLHHRAVKARKEESTEREKSMRLNQATAAGAPYLPNGLLSGSQFGVLPLPDMPTLMEAETMTLFLGSLHFFIHSLSTEAHQGLAREWPPQASKSEEGQWEGEDLKALFPRQHLPLLSESDFPESMYTGKTQHFQGPLPSR